MMKKRGKPQRASQVDIAPVCLAGEAGETGEPRQPRRRDMRWLKTAALAAVAVVVVAGAVYAYLQFMEQKEQERKEDLVWKAMYELSMVEGDKTVNYLRLHDTYYEDGRLKMQFLVHNPGLRPFLFKDSLIRAMFYSVLPLHRERWAAAARYLEEAGVDAELTFIYRDLTSTKVIAHSQLYKTVANDALMEAAVADFAQYKTKELLDYSKLHFKSDNVIFPDSTVLTSDYVTLYLSFDDSESHLGESFLDTTRVGAHFTDVVGEQGSILDGMLSICSRTNRGFAIVYKGSKKNTTHRLQWDRERTRQLLADYSRRIWHKDVKTNQVRTVVRKERK